MTTATAEGRRLRIEVEGIDEPVFVDPLPAKRGRILTDRFLRTAQGDLVGQSAETVFVEALGAANFAWITGDDVDEFDALGVYVGTHHHDRTMTTETVDPIIGNERFRIRQRPENDGLALRDEEGEEIALIAFYWQTVVGMEAVREYLDSGGGTPGSLKAFRLLLTRATLSARTNSSPVGSVSSMPGAHSTGTSDTGNSSPSEGQPASVRLPANRRGFRQNPAKSARPSRRR